MDNREFDHIFWDKLKETQSFDFRQADWEEVAGRLEQKGRRNGLAWWMIGGMLTLLLLSGTVVYQTSQLRQAQKKIYWLEKQILDKKTDELFTSIDSKNIVLIDTIVQYDTLVHTVHINEKVIKRNEVEKANRTNEPFLTGPANSKEKSPRLNLMKRGLLASTMPKKMQENESVESSIQHMPMEALPILLPLKQRTILSELHWEDDPKVNIPKRKKWQSKNRFSVGVFGGLSKPDNYSSTYSDYGNSIVSKKGWETGGQFSYLITRRISANFAIAYQKLQYEVSGLDSLWGIPEITSLPEEAFTLQSANIQQQALNYRLGIHYYFWDQKKWQTFAGVSLEGQSSLRQQVAINFLLTDPPVYVDPELATAETFNKPNFSLHSLIPSVGIKVDLTSHFSWQLEGWLRYQYKDTEDQMTSPLGLRSYLLYQF